MLAPESSAMRPVYHKRSFTSLILRKVRLPTARIFISPDAAPALRIAYLPGKDRAILPSGAILIPSGSSRARIARN
jgi:hypothetical protein